MLMGVGSSMGAMEEPGNLVQTQYQGLHSYRKVTLPLAAANNTKTSSARGRASGATFHSSRR